MYICIYTCIYTHTYIHYIYMYIYICVTTYIMLIYACIFLYAYTRHQENSLGTCNIVSTCSKFFFFTYSADLYTHVYAAMYVCRHIYITWKAAWARAAFCRAAAASFSSFSKRRVVFSSINVCTSWARDAFSFLCVYMCEHVCWYSGEYQCAHAVRHRIHVFCVYRFVCLDVNAWRVCLIFRQNLRPTTRHAVFPWFCKKPCYTKRVGILFLFLRCTWYAEDMFGI